MTIRMDGGIRIPRRTEVVMTPAPNFIGKPALTIAGSMIDPMATTVAGDEPRDCGKQGAGYNAGQGQPAMPVTDHGGGKVDHPPGNTAVGKKITGQDEERDRHDLELLDAGE